MKYICLGYFDESKWETMSESEQRAFMDECFAFDDELRKGGHILGGEALQSARYLADGRRLSTRSARDVPIDPLPVCSGSR